MPHHHLLILIPSTLVSFTVPSKAVRHRHSPSSPQNRPFPILNKDPLLAHRTSIPAAKDLQIAQASSSDTTLLESFRST
jgi:hypothetical protein